MADRLSDEEIAALKGLLAVSVSPPWHTDDDVEGSVSDVVGMARDGETQIVVAECFTEDEARLIAATVSALPSLLSEVLASRSSPQGERATCDRCVSYLRERDEALSACERAQGERERALTDHDLAPVAVEAMIRAKVIEEAARALLSQAEPQFKIAQTFTLARDVRYAARAKGQMLKKAAHAVRALAASSPHYAEKGD